MESPPALAGETPWLFVYGMSSGAYRILIGFSIAYLLATEFLVAGVLLATWFFLFQLVRPMALGLAGLLPRLRREGRLLRFVLVVLVATGLPYAALFLVPMPHATVGHAVLVAPEDASQHLLSGDSPIS